MLADRALEITFDKWLHDILAYNSEEYWELGYGVIIKSLLFPSPCSGAQGFSVFISEERNRIDVQLCSILAVIVIHKYMNQLKMKPDLSFSLINVFPMKFIIYNYLSRFITYFCCFHWFANMNICNDNQVGNIFFLLRAIQQRKINMILIYRHFYCRKIT